MRKLISTVIMLVSVILSQATKRALLIGIGDYQTLSTGWNQIHGHNDVDLLEKKLKEKDFVISSLKDSEATKLNIISSLKTLVAETKPGDVVYINFSGHGQLIEDLNKDEEDGWDQSYVCYDACYSSQYIIDGKPYKGQNHLIDDEIFPYLNQLKSKVGKNGLIVVTFDSCYSGGADRNETYQFVEDEEIEWTDITRGTKDDFIINSVNRSYIQSIPVPGNYGKGGQIVIISACERDKKNRECKERHSGKQYGSLSYCIGKMLDNNVPLNEWANYFEKKKYDEFFTFPRHQNPVLEIH